MFIINVELQKNDRYYRCDTNNYLLDNIRVMDLLHHSLVVINISDEEASRSNEMRIETCQIVLVHQRLIVVAGVDCGGDVVDVLGVKFLQRSVMTISYVRNISGCGHCGKNACG